MQNNQLISFKKCELEQLYKQLWHWFPFGNSCKLNWGFLQLVMMYVQISYQNWLFSNDLLRKPGILKWNMTFTCATGRAGMHLTVVTPSSSKCAAALLQGDMARQHTFTKVLIVQIIVAVLALNWWCWKTREEWTNTTVKDQVGNYICHAQCSSFRLGV